MSTAVATAAPTARRAPARRRRLGSTEIVYLALVGILVIAGVLVAVGGGNLFSTANTAYMLTQTSLLGFVAIGQTFAILCKSLDLSVGYVVALSSIVGATTMAGDPSRVWLGVLAAVGVAAVVGLVNGLVIARLRVNAFIATLGVGLIIKGYLDTQFKGPAGEVPASFQMFG
ncbi:ABC transporter permease, partial [Streptomyces sp. SID13726]|nr:ABC transporter permease [Streptomyces sp. SID13726]